jgi:3-deoxy-7-phosphoheptulonate synthase
MIVEIHPDPANAWSDGPQSLNEKNYLKMMKEVDVIFNAMKQIREM